MTAKDVVIIILFFVSSYGAVAMAAEIAAKIIGEKGEGDE